MLNKICTNILDKNSWHRYKFLFGCSVMLLFAVLFAIENIKEQKTGFSIYDQKDQATIARDVIFFTPSLYAIVTNNPIMLAEYSLISFSAAFLVKKILKFIVKEERPDKSSKHSFPSGHALIAFLTAHFIFLRINKCLGVFYYIIASWISWTRIYYNKHWTHDVIISIFIALFFVHFTTKIASYVVNKIKNF